MLGYEPHPGQLLVHRSLAPRRVLVCGARWGKSTCAAMEAVVALLEPRESALGWVTAPTYSLTRAIFERVRMSILGCLAHRVIEDDEKDYRIVVRNLGGGKSELVAKSAENSASLLGAALDFVIVDEAAQLRRMIWEQCLSQRLLDRRGWALLLSTPRGTNWFYEMYRRGQKGRDAAFESWRRPSRDNPYVDGGLIEAERARLTRDSFESEYEARFLGEDKVERCDLCGGPHLCARAVRILRNGAQGINCVECGLPVHDDGTTAAMLTADGKVWTKSIILHYDLEHPPELPSGTLMEAGS